MPRHEKSLLWIQYAHELSRVWIHSSRFSVTAPYSTLLKHTHIQPDTHRQTDTEIYRDRDMIKEKRVLCCIFQLVSFCVISILYKTRRHENCGRNPYRITTLLCCVEMKYFTHISISSASLRPLKGNYLCVCVCVCVWERELSLAVFFNVLLKKSADIWTFKHTH